jgi:CubicO group peptidase (beta-lactamase class C family)
MTAKGLKRVDRLLRDKVEEDGQLPGAVLLVRGPEGVIFLEAYGLRQKVPNVFPMTRETSFDLASLTKPLCTSLVTMIMTQKGRLNLDQHLETWFSPLKDPGKRRITLRQLLANASGLPAWRPFYREFSKDAVPIPMDAIAHRVLEEPLEALPGKREIYSDLGFLLLGSILERASGLPLDVLFLEEIAGPLGLRRIGFRRRSRDLDARSGEEEVFAATEDCPWRGRILVGEVHDENCHLLGGVGGHAGLFSTAEELDRIAAELFHGFRNRSDLLSLEILKTFFQRQNTGSPGTWALGWDTPSEQDSASGSHYSPNSFGHNGFTGTSLWMDFDRSISVVFLTNRVHPSRENASIRALRPQVHDAVFEEMLDL